MYIIEKWVLKLDLKIVIIDSRFRKIYIIKRLVI